MKNTILVRTFGHFGTFHYPIGHTYSVINMQVFTELYLDFFLMFFKYLFSSFQQIAHNSNCFASH